MELWERQPDESDQAWRAFLSYRDVGIHRTFQASGLPISDTVKLAKKHTWAKRVRAFDDWLESARTDAFRDTSAQLGREAAQAACMGVTVAANAIRGLLARQREGDGTAELISMATAVKLLATSVQVARLLEGKSTENVSINVSELTDEELALLRKPR